MVSQSQVPRPKRTLRRLIASPKAYAGRFLISQRIDRYSGFTNHFTRQKSDWSIHAPPVTSVLDPEGTKKIPVGRISHGRAELFLSLMAAVPLRTVTEPDLIRYDAELMYLRIGLCQSEKFDEDAFGGLLGQGARISPRHWIAETPGRQPLAAIDTDLIGPALRLIWHCTSAEQALQSAHAKNSVFENCRPGSAPLWFALDDDVIEILTDSSEKWQAVIGDDEFCVVRREGKRDWMWTDSLAPGLLPLLSAATARLLPPDEATPIADEARSIDNFDAVVGTAMERAMRKTAPRSKGGA